MEIRRNRWDSIFFMSPEDQNAVLLDQTVCYWCHVYLKPSGSAPSDPKMTRYDDTTFRSHDPPASVSSDEQSEWCSRLESFISVGQNLRWTRFKCLEIAWDGILRDDNHVRDSIQDWPATSWAEMAALRVTSLKSKEYTHIWAVAASELIRCDATGVTHLIWEDSYVPLCRRSLSGWDMYSGLFIWH